MNAILYGLIIVFVVYSIFQALYDNRRNFNFIFLVWKRFSFKMLAECVAVLSALIAFIVMVSHYVPFTNIGWLNFILQEGGNILVAPVLAGSKSSHLLIRLLVPLFFILLIPCFRSSPKLKRTRFGAATSL
jgi:hypothetical protein